MWADLGHQRLVPRDLGRVVLRELLQNHQVMICPGREVFHAFLSYSKTCQVDVVSPNNSCYSVYFFFSLTWPVICSCFWLCTVTARSTCAARWAWNHGPEFHTCCDPLENHFGFLSKTSKNLRCLQSSALNTSHCLGAPWECLLSGISLAFRALQMPMLQFQTYVLSEIMFHFQVLKLNSWKSDSAYYPECFSQSEPVLCCQGFCGSGKHLSLRLTWILS